MIADRMQGFEASGIRKVFDLAQKIENPINLSIGQPDFDIPEEVKKEAVKAIEQGFNRYNKGYA
jgi:aspartate aminotransferase/aminotransferase